MDMLASRLLRVALVVLLLGTVLAQVILPVFASQEGRIFPEVAYLVVPYSAAAILFIGCGQVALLVVWRLLSMVDGGVIFTRRALRWVDVITACAAVATVLSAGVLIHMLSFVPGGGGPTFYYVAACVAGGLAFVLLMVVMRGLLESAIADRTELDEVI
jgi:peptidoglycan/LPS O-acetylase OafA/YrhL